MKASRTQKSVVNTAVSFASQLIIILLGFISRRVLIYSVGVQYLGINALMSNILTVFSLAESGIGLAIGYSLYKPLAENNEEMIKSLMHFYRVTYRVLAGLTLLVGLVFYPYLPLFLKGNTAPDVNIIYFLFLASSACSYLFTYKTTLNNSDQNKYLYTIANTLTQIFILVAKVCILYFTQNFVIYLSVELGSSLIKNIYFSRVMDKRYPFLKEKNIQKLEKAEKKKLFKNIKSLFLGKLGYIMSQSSDNLVASSIVSVTAVGMYSNYTVLLSSVAGFVSTFSGGVTASMGNLLASESKEKGYDTYRKIDFINYWLYTASSICLLCLTEPFIKIWLGEAYVLSKGILIAAVATFYLKGINSGLDIAKNAAGLYHPDRYVPVMEAVFNLIISIALAYRIGLLGVLIGTLLSFAAFSFWTKPYFVYRDVFGISFSEYAISAGRRIFVSAALAALLYFAQSSFSLYNPYLELIVKTIFTVVSVNLLLALVFYKTDEFAYIRYAGKSILKHIGSRLKGAK